MIASRQRCADSTAVRSTSAAISVGRALWPAVAQGESERAPLGGVEGGHVGREIDRLDLGPHCAVQRAVLERRDFSEPVPTPAALPAREQPVEEMMGRGVDDDP